MAVSLRALPYLIVLALVGHSILFGLYYWPPSTTSPAAASTGESSAQCTCPVQVPCVAELPANNNRETCPQCVCPAQVPCVSKLPNNNINGDNDDDGHKKKNKNNQEGQLTLRIYQHSAACYGDRCPFTVAPPQGCLRQCEFIGHGADQAMLRQADVVIWDAIQSAAQAKQCKQSHQKYIGFFWESPSNYPVLKDQGMMDVFDYEYSWRMTADVHQFSMIIDTTGSFEHVRHWPVVPFEKKKANPMITAWISNCYISNSNRLDILSQLIKYGVTVRNYGRCSIAGMKTDPQTHDLEWEDTNHVFPKLRDRSLRVPDASSFERCIENIYEGAYSLFYFAAENTNCEYYHTEKGYIGLSSGAVPIYLGSRHTQKEYFPEKSMIYVSDFPDVASLASYLLNLSNNKAAYNEYLQWRTKPFPPYLQTKIDHGLRREDDFCRLCDILHRNHNSTYRRFLAPTNNRCP